jgi:outer membrane protein assembly factor BamB
MLMAGFALILAASAADAPTPAWPQWRGPGGHGVSSETGAPREWSEEKNVLWKVAIQGQGHSSPIVWGDRVFLTTAVLGDAILGARAMRQAQPGKELAAPEAVGADHKRSLKVLCLNAADGKLLWERTAFTGPPLDSRHRKANFAAQTPATDGKRVYAFFGAQGLYAFDMDGTPVFRVSPGALGRLGIGDGTSPLLWQGLVILLCDDDTGARSFLAAFDKKTGLEVWRTPPRDRLEWSTPTVSEVDGVPQLIVGASQNVMAFDPATGRELWQSKGLVAKLPAAAKPGEDPVVLSAGLSPAVTLAVRGGSARIPDKSRVLWTYANGGPYVGSPLAYRDDVYLMTGSGHLTCLDAMTGGVKYEDASVPASASVFIAPLAYDGQIVLANEAGEVFLVKAGPSHELLHANSIGEALVAAPAIAGGRIFLRGAGHLYCIGSS